MHAVLTEGQAAPAEATFAWLAPDGNVIVSDSRTGIVAEMLAGYPDDAEGSLLRRYDALMLLCPMIQAQAISAAVDHDPERMTEDQLTILLGHKDFGHPCPGEWPDEAPDLWLVATHYAPYTTAEPPTGERVHLLDPYSETTFLDSLADMGLGELMTREADDDDR